MISNLEHLIPKVWSSLVKPILKAYSEIFFIRNTWIGLGICIVSLVSNLNVGFSGLISVVFTLLFIKLFGLSKSYNDDGVLIYNPLLVGFAVGMAFKLKISVIFLLFCSSFLTFLLTLSLRKLFQSFNLPLLSLPFSLASLVFYLATSGYNKLFYLFDYHFYSDELIGKVLPDSLLLFFKTVGSIIFIPSATVGCCIVLLLSFKSRVIPLMMGVGLLIGLSIESLFVGAVSETQHIQHSFNYILCSVAISSVFLVPGPLSILVASFAVALSTIFIDAFVNLFSVLHLPVFALPFNIVSFLVIYTLRYVKFSQLPIKIGETPEKSSEYSYHQNTRFKVSEVQLSLPFFGEWNVYQGFSGEWTHQGIWKYAYDFNCKDENGCSYKGEGLLEDFYAYGKDVHSPVNGYIHTVVNGLSDNPIGKVDTLNNWGNYILIRTIDGLYVLIAHLKEGSATYNVGDWVGEGSVLAQCGNSGYSPEPHIHIQVQETPFIGSETIPFIFKSYFEKNEYVNYGLPCKESRVNAIKSSIDLEGILSFNLSEKFSFLETQNGFTKVINIEVKMNRLTGEFYFEDQFLNKLFFARDNQKFYFYDYQGKSNSCLLKMFQVIPKIPLVHSTHYEWNESVPEVYFQSGLEKIWKGLIGTLFSFRKSNSGKWSFHDDLMIDGALVDDYLTKNVRIKLNPNGGFELAEDAQWKIVCIS